MGRRYVYLFAQLVHTRTKWIYDICDVVVGEVNVLGRWWCSFDGEDEYYYLHEVHVFDVVGVVDWVVDEGYSVGGGVALALGEVGP